MTNLEKLYFEFLNFEEEHDVFNLVIREVPVWTRIRKVVFTTIQQKLGKINIPHTSKKFSLRRIFNAIFNISKNPYFAGKKELLIFGHPRRKLLEDGYWWDIYCDFFIQKIELDYLYLEFPYLSSHLVPQKTKQLRYMDFLRIITRIKIKLGLSKIKLSKNELKLIRDLEDSIKEKFSVEIGLKSLIINNLEFRKASYPLYQKLINKLSPKLVLIVVSGGKKTLIEVCQEKNIPVIELQHGILFKNLNYHYPGKGNNNIIYPNYLFTFGEIWSEDINFPIPKQNIIPVGFPYLEHQINKDLISENKNKIIFISQGTIGYKLSRFALQLLQEIKNKDLNLDIIYKLHPGEYENWETRYPWLIDKRIFVVDSDAYHMYQLFQLSIAVIGVSSFAMIEALMFDTIVYQLEEFGNEYLKIFTEKNYIVIVKSPSDLIAKIKNRQKKKLNKDKIFVKNSLKNILETLKKLMENN